MSEHRYILEPYKGMNTRYRCPSCQHRDKTFSLYIDTETGEHIHPTVGRCNRESNCGYHYTPKQYFQDNPGISWNTPQPQAYRLKPATPKPKPVTFVAADAFKKSLRGYENNHFTTFLTAHFGAEAANRLISKYFIGTSRYWPGSTIFWQIDNEGKIRTGKIILYDANTGKRDKDPYKHPTWVHSVANLPDFNLKQCFFGEHLLKARPTAPVAIVESEKTAIIASVYLPQFIWLACGSLTGLNPDKCKALTGKKVILYPDLNGFEKWTAKAKELPGMTNYAISDLLERKATEEEKKCGLDLGDYLLRFKPKAEEQNLDPTNILIENIIAIPCEVITGEEFQKHRIVWIKTTKGKDFEILFNNDGNPCTDPEMVKRIGSFYGKKFREVLFDDKPAFCQIN